MSILNIYQQRILEKASEEEMLIRDYYFTGGTALAEFYLKHRESVDLDFFTEKIFNKMTIIDMINRWSNDLKFRVEIQIEEPVFICLFNYRDGFEVKVDFSYYPYKRLEKSGIYAGKIAVDSELDIAVNKLVTITQRKEVKDFVDLYWLLRKYSIWDLIKGVEVKFNVELEPLNVASHFIAVESFEYLPKIVVPLDLDSLKKYFLDKAVSLGKKLVER